MVALTGYLLSSNKYGSGNPLISTDLDIFEPQLYTPHGTTGPRPVFGTTALGLPGNVQHEAKSGFVMNTFFEDFYLRIQVTPLTIDAGSLLSSQTRIIKVWNAFLTPVTVESVEFEGFDGMTLIPPATHPNTPYVLQPLEEINYQVQIGINGPPVIAATVIIHTSTGDVTITITGSRVVLFPFKPNWSSQIAETLSARSTTIRSYGGTEQTVAMRRKVRRNFTIPYSVRDLDAQLFANLIVGWQNRLYGLPIWPEQSYSTADLASGSSVVQAATSYRSFQSGGLVMVYYGKNSSDYEVREIDTMTSSSISVKIPFTRNWAKGSKVIPVLLAAMDASVSGTYATSGALAASIGFSCEPSTTDDNANYAEVPATYRGYELYLGITNWRDPNAFNFNTDAQMVDMQSGVFEMVGLSPYSSAGRSHDWFMKTLQAVQQFRSWVYRRRGKAIGCWMPSSLDDFTIASDYPASGLSITVKTNGYATFIQQADARKDLYIQLRNGNYYARRITASVDNGDGTTSLTLDTAIPENMSASTIRRFSYLTFYRMSSDDVPITWYVDGVAEATTGLLPAKAVQ